MINITDKRLITLIELDYHLYITINNDNNNNIVVVVVVCRYQTRKRERSDDACNKQRLQLAVVI